MLNKRIYYISGFDPRGARFYHQLFKEESKKSELLSGASISTTRRKVVDQHVTNWQIDSIWNGVSYKIDYRFMNWDDVIKHYWLSNVWLLIFKSIPMYFNHLKIRLFPKFKKAGRGPYICIIYPLVFCLLSLFLTVLTGFLLYFLVSYISNFVILAVLTSVAGMYYFSKFMLHIGDKFNVWWILQTYLFLSLWMQNPLPELETKLKAFAKKIVQEQEDFSVDEVIVVGHCFGSLLVVQMMAELLNLNHDKLKNKLTVVTLGQCIPYLSYAPSASHFREKLQAFANNKFYSWFDMGARADMLCFQQVNPAKAEGVRLESDAVPNQFVVKPFEMFSPERYKVIKKNKMRIHFQYLMAADLKNEFDYFEIVTGPPNSIQKYKI